MTDVKRDALREMALGMLEHIQTIDDKEVAHMQADAVLMSLLTALGFSDVVREYEKVEKWYA